jgi:hypothetical protein
MKNKAIISLIMISVMVISAAIALAQTWSPSSTVSDPDWDVMTGQFGGSFSGSGVYALGTDYATAGHSLPASSDGNFTLTIPFTLNGANTTAYVGLSTASDAQTLSGWTVIGNGPGNAFGYSHGGLGSIDYFANVAPTKGTTYTARIVSTDGGQTAKVSVDGYGATETVSLGGTPKFVILYLNNNGTTGASGAVPMVSAINYVYNAAASPTPTPTISPTPTTSPTPTPTTSPTATPTPTQTPTKVSYDLQAIREFYAKQPVGHMSNQSVVYNPDGTIKQVITGTTTTNATTPVVSPTVQPTVKPNVTVTATATATPSNATVVPSTPAPTKAQSPGFEIILATMGMLAAMALITRKKK